MTDCCRCQVLLVPFVSDFVLYLELPQARVWEFILYDLVEDCQDWDFWNSTQAYVI